MYSHLRSAKEILRHILFRTKLDAAINAKRRLKGREVSHLQADNLQSVFAEIYENGVWIEHPGQESRSGEGSTETATAQLVSDLSNYLREVQCQTLVDIGCGDFNWMRRVSGDFRYIGVDIVPSIISANSEKYGNERRQFICADASRDRIPLGDCVICREVIFHLSFDSALKLLHRIRSASFKYIILTTDKSIWFNSDIRDGDFRWINLCCAPFNFPSPTHEFKDDHVSNGRVLGVWSGAALPG